MSYTETVHELEHDGRKLRVRKTVDEYPSAPYNDGGSPVIRVETSRWGGATATQDTDVTSYVVHERILRALELWADDHEKFERYVRAFHGVRDVVWFRSSVDRGSPEYVTLDPANWREEMGLTDEYLRDHAEHFTGPLSNADEYRAWLDGDVWLLTMEEEITYREVSQTTDEHESLEEITQWRELETVGGFYGDYADEAALELLHEQLPHPWLIVREETGTVLAAFRDEETRDESLATREWPEGAGPAYVEEDPTGTHRTR